MSRRSQPAEMEFGSDSFLDIVANLVGVLIILIVVMGIRVAQQAATEAHQKQSVVEIQEEKAVIPLSTPAPAEVPTPVKTAPVVTEPTVADLDMRLQRNSQIEQQNLARREAFERQQKHQANLEAELAYYQQMMANAGSQDQTQASKLSEAQAALAETNLALQRLNESLSEMKQREDELAGRMSLGQEKLRQLDATTKNTLLQLNQEQARTESLESDITKLTKKQAELRTEIEQKFKEAQSHLAVLQKLGDAPPSTKKITHQMTSMGAIVVKEESHFRLQNGRISYIPVLELIGQVKHDLEAHKEELLRTKSRYSTVGPVNGFSMRYKASRQEVSVVDELRMGGGMFKIGVDYWELFEGGLAESEPVNIALMPNSQFINRLRSLNPNDHNITLWVYPDSYDLYQQLRGPIEKAGFQIAARPLPEGVPIAGSPTGSKSLSQ